MFLDHWYYIIGGDKILNVIGRIAFPIFAFTLSEGYVHTRNLKKYMFRLLIFAIIIQTPSILFNYNYPMNVFFTLFLGLFTIFILDFKKIWLKLPISGIIKFILILAVLVLAQRFNFDYGAYGIVLIMIFFIFRNNKFQILMNFFILNLINFIFPQIFDLSKLQFFSLISLIFIFMYNGKKRKSMYMKYFFYLFYPLHFFILEIINKFFNKI